MNEQIAQALSIPVLILVISDIELQLIELENDPQYEPLRKNYQETLATCEIVLKTKEEK